MHDLPGFRASDSSPATVLLHVHVLVTSAGPDNVIVKDVTITLLLRVNHHY